MLLLKALFVVLCTQGAHSSARPAFTVEETFDLRQAELLQNHIAVLLNSEQLVLNMLCLCKNFKRHIQDEMREKLFML